MQLQVDVRQVGLTEVALPLHIGIVEQKSIEPQKGLQRLRIILLIEIVVTQAVQVVEPVVNRHQGPQPAALLPPDSTLLKIAQGRIGRSQTTVQRNIAGRIGLNGVGQSNGLPVGHGTHRQIASKLVGIGQVGIAQQLLRLLITLLGIATGLFLIEEHRVGIEHKLGVIDTLGLHTFDHQSVTEVRKGFPRQIVQHAVGIEQYRVGTPRIEMAYNILCHKVIILVAVARLAFSLVDGLNDKRNIVSLQRIGYRLVNGIERYGLGLSRGTATTHQYPAQKPRGQSPKLYYFHGSITYSINNSQGSKGINHSRAMPNRRQHFTTSTRVERAPL